MPALGLEREKREENRSPFMKYWKARKPRMAITSRRAMIRMTSFQFEPRDACIISLPYFRFDIHYI